jgi:hypothetical protein
LFISSFVSTPAFITLDLAFAALTIVRGALLFTILFEMLKLNCSKFKEDLVKVQKRNLAQCPLHISSTYGRVGKVTRAKKMIEKISDEVPNLWYLLKW